MNKGEVESHLVLLVNDSDRADAPNLVVLDIAAAPGEAPITPTDLAGRRMLLDRAVPFQQWQREQQGAIGQLDEADRGFFAIEFDSRGEPLARLSTTQRPVVSSSSPGLSPPSVWSSRAPPPRRSQFALAGHRTPGDGGPPGNSRPATPGPEIQHGPEIEHSPEIEHGPKAVSRSGQGDGRIGSRPLSDPGGRSGENAAGLVGERFPAAGSPAAGVLARHVDAVGVERFLVVKEVSDDGGPGLWRLPSTREAELDGHAMGPSSTTEAGIVLVEASERFGAGADRTEIADAQWLTHAELDLRVSNRQVQEGCAAILSSVLPEFDQVPSPADAAGELARLGSRLTLSADDIDRLIRRLTGRPADAQEKIVGYFHSLADEFESNKMAAEAYAEDGHSARLADCLRRQQVRISIAAHPDIEDVILAPQSDVILFEMVHSDHWTGATIGDGIEFLAGSQVSGALREIHRNNSHFARYVGRRMSKPSAADFDSMRRELSRIAEIPGGAVESRLLEGFGRYVPPPRSGDIGRVIFGGSPRGDEVTSQDRAWDFLLSLDDFSPGSVRQKFADVFLAAGQIANIPDHVSSDVTFTAQRLREVEEIYLTGPHGGDFIRYVEKVSELPPSQRPPTVRAAMELVRDVTPEFARCLRDLVADGAQAVEREVLGLRHAGDAGIRELKEIARSFVTEVKSASISPENLAKVQSSEFLARLLIAVTNYDTSGWGPSGVVSLRELLGHHDRAAAEGRIAPMPAAYRTSGVLEVAKLRTRSSESGPQWTEDLLTRFARLSENLRHAHSALTGVPRPFTYLLGKLGRGIAEHIEALERSIASGTLADGAPMNDMARRNMVARAQELKELTAPEADGTTQFPMLRSLRDFERNFQRLARVGELHDDLRTICFAWAMRQHPEWVDRLSDLRSDEPTLEHVSLVRDFVEHITNREVFEHYFSNRKGANIFRRMTSVAALDEAILRTQGVGVSSDTTRLQFVPTRGPLLELSGHIASACWAGKYPSVAAAMPNMTAVIMVRNPDDPGRTALAGAGLLIETTNASGEPILLVRGLNPLETYINHVSVADFYRKFTDWAQGIAAARGRRLAIVIDGRAGGAATNRPVLFGHLAAERRKLTPVQVDPGDTVFNGYNVTQCAYLVQADNSPDEREQRAGPRGPGGLIGSRPSTDPEGGAERSLPLPAEIIAREIDEVTEILRARVPLEQLGDPDIRRGIRLAAEGLFANRTLYGHPDIGRADQIHNQAFELREFGVAALNHNGMDVAEHLRRIVDNGVLQGAGLREIIWAMAADAWSDLVYGGGRRSDDGEGYDELRSAELLHDRALLHGFDPSAARILAFAVNGTGFDEWTRSQLIASPAAVGEMRQRWGR